MYRAATMKNMAVMTLIRPIRSRDNRVSGFAPKSFRVKGSRILLIDLGFWIVYILRVLHF